MADILQHGGCKIMYYVHIPKTAGSSMNRKFKLDLGQSIFHPSKDEGGTYSQERRTSKPYRTYKSLKTNNTAQVLSAEHGIDYFVFKNNGMSILVQPVSLAQ
jgi:hypothetical protein